MRTLTPAQRGFTLVEVMVAVALGLIVTAAVLAIYLTSTTSYAQDERYVRMQENGRYALRVIAEDLRMADFWGKMTAPGAIATALTAASTCAASIDLLDAEQSLLFNRYHSPQQTQFAPCSTVTAMHESGTDMLVIKRVQKQSGATAGLRLRTNGISGTLLDSGTPNAAAGEADWAYQPRLYFIRSFSRDAGDGIPALCRLGLAAPPDHLQLTRVDCPAEGIEDFHVVFGLDTDEDGVANRYSSSPSLDEMETVVTARVYVLARSADADAQHTDAKSFRLGDVDVAARNDGFYRQVYTTTVSLRNPASLALLNN
jgi:type IV pilus assembly protein PilW